MQYENIIGTDQHNTILNYLRCTESKDMGKYLNRSWLVVSKTAITFIFLTKSSICLRGIRFVKRAVKKTPKKERQLPIFNWNSTQLNNMLASIWDHIWKALDLFFSKLPLLLTFWYVYAWFWTAKENWWDCRKQRKTAKIDKNRQFSSEIPPS